MQKFKQYNIIKIKNHTAYEQPFEPITQTKQAEQQISPSSPNPSPRINPKIGTYIVI